MVWLPVLRVPPHARPRVVVGRMHTALAAADNCSPCLYHRSHRSMRRHKLTTCSTRGVAECSTPRLFRSLLCPGPMPHATSPCTPRPPKYECVSEALEVPSGHLRSVLKSSQVKATSRQVKSSQSPMRALHVGGQISDKYPTATTQLARRCRRATWRLSTCGRWPPPTRRRSALVCTLRVSLGW